MELASSIDSPHGKLLVKTIRAALSGVDEATFSFDTDHTKTVRSALKEIEPNHVLDESVNSISYWTEIYSECLDETGTSWKFREIAAIRMIETLLFYYKKNILNSSMIKVLFQSMNENITELIAGLS